jgi:hypothetical protein
MYKHMSKCKNDKSLEKKIKTQVPSDSTQLKPKFKSSSFENSNKISSRCDLEYKTNENPPKCLAAKNLMGPKQRGTTKTMDAKGVARGQVNTARNEE